MYIQCWYCEFPYDENKYDNCPECNQPVEKTTFVCNKCNMEKPNKESRMIPKPGSKKKYKVCGDCGLLYKF